MNKGERTVDFQKGSLLEERDMVLIVDFDGGSLSMRAAMVSMGNGLVSTAMPGASWPLPTAAFSA
ncbi:hypothetical protein [Tardiphaga sp. OK246]|uniref:hypothetical protein n=1 Tax=Tardiphaga sp. OK246 TaxID=1855307 RepID=UPI001595FAC8|nr:hypothetical protein [Tardiphaga sp. OK246]